MPRLGWGQLPPDLRARIEEIAGGSVVEAESQPGGYSPGSADRLLLADGRRVFAKAVGGHLNPDSPGIHRREIAVTAGLPDTAPTPRLLGYVDEDGWVALVLDDVAGRHPTRPWQAGELDACLSALDRLAASCTPNPVSGLPDAPAELAPLFAGWERVAADPVGVDPAALVHLAQLRELAAGAAAAVAGDTLVHLDIRADNLLIDAEDRVWLVDWPWACVGCDWFDTLTLLADVAHGGTSGFTVDEYLPGVPRLARVSPTAVDAVLAGLAGFLLDSGRRPTPPGLPTLRSFQAAQGVAILAWLGRRLRWP